MQASMRQSSPFPKQLRRRNRNFQFNRTKKPAPKNKCWLCFVAVNRLLGVDCGIGGVVLDELASWSHFLLTSSLRHPKFVSE